MSKKYVIVISRTFGSGGREIGEKLSEKLGIPLYDKTILAKVAEEQNISDERLRSMDEYLNAHRFKNIGIHAAGFRLHTYEALFETDTVNYLDRNKVFEWQSDIIKRLAEEGPCIIIGRCADYVLRDDPGLISLFITAPRHLRVDRIARLHPNHPAEHHETYNQFVAKTDRLRTHYYDYHTDRHWGEIGNYDLCIDSSKLGIDGTVEMLTNYVKCRTE